MHERRFSGGVERLRDPQRLSRLEVGRVTALSVERLDGVQSVLDIGTGSGIFAEAFAGMGLAVSGVDANPEMLVAAQRFVPTGIFKEGAAEELPFPGAVFDLAFMGLLLHESDDIPAALKEAYRVCARRLVILEWPYEEQDFGPPVEIRIKAETISRMGREAGFKKIEVVRLEMLVLYRLDKKNLNH
jgi:SAM-dependent methyltransferase